METKDKITGELRTFFADCLEEFGWQLREGEDPSFEMVIAESVVIEIRLMHCPGQYTRHVPDEVE